jgi:hypothetical protein
VLTDSEQRSWDEIERMWNQDSRGSNGIRALAVGAVGIALMFAVVGAPWAGLAVLAVPALAWVLSRYWRDIGTACEAALLPVAGRTADETAAREPMRSDSVRG